MPCFDAGVDHDVTNLCPLVPTLLAALTSCGLPRRISSCLLPFPVASSDLARCRRRWPHSHITSLSGATLVRRTCPRLWLAGACFDAGVDDKLVGRHHVEPQRPQAIFAHVHLQAMQMQSDINVVASNHR